MFVPEVRLEHWEDFERIASKCKVKTCCIVHGYLRNKLLVQAFDGTVVYTIEQPEHRSRKAYLLGRNVREAYLLRKIRGLPPEERDKLYYQWWQKRLKRALRILLQEGFLEGRFVSLVPVAEVESP